MNKLQDSIYYLKKAINGDLKYKNMAKTDKNFGNMGNYPDFKELIV